MTSKHEVRPGQVLLIRSSRRVLHVVQVIRPHTMDGDAVRSWSCFVLYTGTPSVTWGAAGSTNNWLTDQLMHWEVVSDA